MKYPIGTKIKFSNMTLEKRPHGWTDAGCNEVIVDESKIGSVYELQKPRIEIQGQTKT